MMATKKAPAKTYYGYEVRKLKTFQGREGLGFNVELWKDGRKAMLVMDDASGGEARYDFVDGKDEADLKKAVEAARATIPADRETHAGFNDREIFCAGIFVEDIVTNATYDRRFDRMSKTKTIFQVGGDIGSDRFRTFKEPFSPSLLEFMLKTFSGQRIFVHGHGIVAEGKA